MLPPTAAATAAVRSNYIKDNEYSQKQIASDKSLLLNFGDPHYGLQTVGELKETITKLITRFGKYPAATAVKRHSSQTDSETFLEDVRITCRKNQLNEFECNDYLKYRILSDFPSRSWAYKTLQSTAHLYSHESVRISFLVAFCKPKHKDFQVIQDGIPTGINGDQIFERIQWGVTRL